MNKRRLLTTLVSFGPLAICAATAFGATSGVAAIDLPLNTLGNVAKACGYMVGGVGAIGIVHHVRSGSWLGAAEHLGLATLGGAVIYNYSALAPNFGGSAAALIHPVATIVNHPATHAAIHAVRHLVG